MPVNLTKVTTTTNQADAIAAQWNDGQFIVLVAPKGLVACGIIDFSVTEKFNFAAAIAHGTPEKPLITADDLLEAKVTEVTDKAKEYGIIEGMTGREALDLLS